MPVTEVARQTRFKWWRRGILLGALALLVQVPVDLHYAEGPLLAGMRLVWCALLLGGALLLDPASHRRSLAVLHVLAAISAAFATTIVALGGGTASPRYGFLMTFPLLVFVLVPDLPWVAAIVGLGTVLGGAAMLLNEGRDGWWLAEWAIMTGAATAFAVGGAVAFRRTLLAEVSAERARADVLAQLAESEKRRGQVERLALAGRIAAGVAHEINNPLSFVKANLRFIREKVRDGGPDLEECREVADETLQGVDRIAQIVTDLRGLAREGVEVVGPCDVEALAREALRLASGRLAAVQVRVTFEPGLPQAVASPRLLVQALVNLLANAADATGPQPPERRWVSLTAVREGERVKVAVEDGGPGLPPEVERNLFQPFISTKGAAGTGLGLALAREQIGRCHGTIEGGNREGGGAVFTLRLGVAAAGQGQVAEEGPLLTPPPTQLRARA